MVIEIDWLPKNDNFGVPSMKSWLETLTLFRMVLVGAAHGLGGPLLKICHTYPIMMKLGIFIPYLKKIQKIYKSRDTFFKFCWHQYFLPEISKFCYIKKYRYSLYFDTLFLILLTFFWVLKAIWWCQQKWSV